MSYPSVYLFSVDNLNNIIKVVSIVEMSEEIALEQITDKYSEHIIELLEVVSIQTTGEIKTVFEIDWSN